MAAVAPQVLDDDVGAVGLERYAVVSVVDMGVLNDDVVGAVCVPTIRELASCCRKLSKGLLTHRCS